MIDPAAPPLLKRLGLDAQQWHTQATGIEQRYWRAVGAVDALIEKARNRAMLAQGQRISQSSSALTLG